MRRISFQWGWGEMARQGANQGLPLAAGGEGKMKNKKEGATQVTNHK